MIKSLSLTAAAIACLLIGGLGCRNASSPANMPATPTTQPLCPAAARPSGCTARGLMKLTDRIVSSKSASNGLDNKWAVQRRQNEQVLLMLAEASLDRMLKQSEARNLRWWKIHQSDAQPMVAVLARALSAKAVPDTSLIEVSVTDADAEAAAEMCNFVMRYYEDLNRRKTAEDLFVQRKVLADQLHKFEAQLRAIDAEMEKMRQSEDFDGLERSRSQIVERVAQLENLQTVQQLKIAELTRRVQQLPKGDEQAAARKELDEATALLKTIEKNLAEAQQRNRKVAETWERYQSLRNERDRMEEQRRELQNRLTECQMMESLASPEVEIFALAPVPRK